MPVAHIRSSATLPPFPVIVLNDRWEPGVCILSCPGSDRLADELAAVGLEGACWRYYWPTWWYI